MDRKQTTKSTKRETERERHDQTEAVLPSRKKRVFAGACPNKETHANTRVYKTDGLIRYCVCDDCGHTWKQTGPKAESEPAAADIS